MRRRDIEQPDEIRAALVWVGRSARRVPELGQPATTRGLLRAIALKNNHEPAGAQTVARRRGVLVNAMEYAVERGLLLANPIKEVKRKAPAIVKTVDRRVVVNHGQAIKLLNAVGMEEPSDPRLVAFFAVMYYAAALRPSEAVNLRRSNLLLPEEGWGELLIEQSSPASGPAWTDTGVHRELRPLKHRAKGDTRVVPSPPS